MKLKQILAIAGLVGSMGISTAASAWFVPFNNGAGATPWGNNNMPWSNGNQAGGAPWNNGPWNHGGNNNMRWNNGSYNPNVPPQYYNRGNNAPWANNMPWNNGNYNGSSPWGNNMPWNGSPWSNSPMGNMNGPWDSGPWNSGWNGAPNNFNNNNAFRSGPGGYMDPADPKGSMGRMWDDMLTAPNEMGEMPGGWTAPSIKVPNPVEVGDEFEGAARKAPAEAAEQLNNFRFN